MLRTNGRVFARTVVFLLTFGALPALGGIPILYSAPAYESPVRGGPDDLLLISGSGLSATSTVVYAAVADTTLPQVPPTGIPASSSATQGVLDLVSAADAPYSLSVHLPKSMVQNQAYALWVVTPDGQWSAPVLINDARPLWITPDFALQAGTFANLPRVLKVVGRNLQPTDMSPFMTQVRLTGISTGTTYTMTASSILNDVNSTPALERYVAKVSLPSQMAVDRYSVQVSRDGSSWVSLLGSGQSSPQTFEVRAKTAASPVFNVSDFAGMVSGSGPCLPDDGIDDTGCILLAIRAAQAAGGGTVQFGPGTWTMSQIGPFIGQYSDRLGLVAGGSCGSYFDTCAVTFFGVFVPPNVNLRGAGATGTSATIIERGADTGQAGEWPLTWPLFTFQGNNFVSGVDFTDDNNYPANYANNNTNGGVTLMLGATWYFARLYGASLPLTASNVTINNNVFDKPYIAISDGGLPVDHVYITGNTFGGAYTTAISVFANENNALNLGPNPLFTPYQGYHWNDTIVAHNTFYPSSLQVTAAAYNSGAPGGNGSIASEIDTGLRQDFSDNVADGTSTQYFYNPADPRGWRAAFLWSTGASQEMTLVSNNTITCSGDKYGDGEAILYDGSGTSGGTPYAEPVLSAAPWTDAAGIAGTTVTVQGVVATQLPVAGGPVDVSANPTPYYEGFWAQVVKGAGKGQWRKVESVTLGANGTGATVTLNVTPAFDVPPDATSMVTVGRAYWQNATVSNYIDQRTTICTRANVRDTGGIISWYAGTADSAIEGNEQFDTSGIFLNNVYTPQSPGASPVKPAILALQSHNEVRNNLIDGSYDESANGMQGGIQLAMGATGWFCDNNTCPAPPPPIAGIGVSIAGNTIIEATSRAADDTAHPPIGAIGSNAGWESGLWDVLGLSMWQLGSDTLIFGNTLLNISNAAMGTSGGLPLVAIGVDVGLGSTPTPAVTWRSTLYNNTCGGADSGVRDFGMATVRYCPSGHSGSCECSGVADVDVGVIASGSASPVSAGSSVIYTATVTNHGATTAVDVNLSLESSAGVQISAPSFASSQGSCDSSVNVCLLGSLVAGQSASVTVNGTLPTSGTWPVTFSVTHAEADSVPTNDSVAVSETVL
jgi:hypothetical protein